KPVLSSPFRFAFPHSPIERLFMSKVAITLYGREYFVSCDPGDETRLNEVVKIVEGRMRKVAERAGSTITDHRLFMLTCLGLADELNELRQSSERSLSEMRQNSERSQRQEEDIMVAAADHLYQRIAHIASQVGRA